MEYKYLGYFLAVIVIVLGSVLVWIVRMVFKEKLLIKKLLFVKGDVSEEEEIDK